MRAAELQHAGQKRTIEDRDVAEDDFIIYSSQSYTRIASQALPESDASQVGLHQAACFVCWVRLLIWLTFWAAPSDKPNKKWLTLCNFLSHSKYCKICFSSSDSAGTNAFDNACATSMFCPVHQVVTSSQTGHAE